MGYEKYVRRIIRVMGVEFPTPREVPNMLPETPQDLMYVQPSANTEGTIAKGLFDVMGEGLVESKLKAGLDSIMPNLKGMRALALHTMVKLSQDTELDALIYDRLSKAGSVPVPPEGPQEPDTEMGLLQWQRNERLKNYMMQMNEAVAERRRLCQGYSATPQCIAADKAYFSHKKSYDALRGAPIVRPAPVTPPPPPTDPGVVGRRKYVFWTHQANNLAWAQRRGAFLTAVRQMNALTNEQYNAMVTDPNHPVMKEAVSRFQPEYDQFVQPLADEMKLLDEVIREGTMPVGHPDAAQYAPYAHFAPAYSRTIFDNLLKTWKGA